MAVIRLMAMDDYDSVIQLMQATPGVSIREADSRESTQQAVWPGWSSWVS